MPTQDLARQIRDALTHAHGASSSSLPPDQQLKNKKLLQDFATMLQDYKATQKLAQDRESLSLPKPNPPSSSTARGVAGLPAEQAAGGGVESAIEQQALLQVGTSFGVGAYKQLPPVTGTMWCTSLHSAALALKTAPASGGSRDHGYAANALAPMRTGTEGAGGGGHGGPDITQ